MQKRLIVGVGTGVLAAASFFVVAAVSAQTTATAAQTAPSQPMVVEIGQKGNVLLRGTVDSVGSGSLTVKSWGGDWTVNVPSSASVLPATAGGISGFQTGDFVGVQGAISESGNWAVDATLVRDWTVAKTTAQQETQNQQATRQTMKSETPKIYQGTVSAMSDSSFTLTPVNGTAYTVNIATGAKILNKKWASIAAASIQNGNTVRVFGTNASGTIAATVVRDTSL